MNSSDVDGVLRFEEGGAEECPSGGEGPPMDGVTLPSIRSGRKGRGGSRKTASVGRWRRRAGTGGEWAADGGMFLSF